MSYQNLPKITDFSYEEFNSFLQSSYKRKTDFEKVANPFKINILKQDMESILNDGNVSPTVMAFFVNYIKTAVTVFDIERSAFLIAFKVTNFSKFNKTLAFEYLETLNNPYMGNKKEIIFKGMNIVMTFFYDERWIMAVYDPKLDRLLIADFLPRELSKVSHEEVSDILKAYLKQEYDLKPGSFVLNDKTKSKTYDTCGLYACKYLVAYYINLVDYDKIALTENEKNDFKRILAWLAVKVDLKKNSNVNFLDTSRDKSIDKILPMDLGNNPRTARSKATTIIRPIKVSTQNSIDKEVKPTKRDNEATIKLSKDELAKILNQVKTDILQEEDSDIDISNVLRDEELFEDSDVSREEVSKDKLKKLLKKMDKKKKHRNHKHEQMSYDEYMQGASQYSQDAQRLYGMLSYFQQSNPKLYHKIAKDINNQMEDDMLSQFGMLHLKYGHGHHPHTYLPGFLGQNKQPTLLKQPTLFQHQPTLLKQPTLFHQPTMMQQPDAEGINGMMPQLPRTLTKKMTLMDPLNLDRSPRKKFTRLAPVSPGDTSISSNLLKTPSSPALMTPYGIPLSPAVPARSGPQFNLKQMGSWGSFFEEEVEGFKADNDLRNQLVAKRYGIKISRYDFQKIKNENLVSTEVINFFLGYLREKQHHMPEKRVRNFESNILYFGPEFYEMLTSGSGGVRQSGFEKVKRWTETFTGTGKTVFDVLNKIVIIIRVSGVHHVLVCIQNTDKKIYLFDPSKPKEPANENPVLVNILQYMDYEYQDKALSRMDLTRWQMLYGEMTRVNDVRESGFWCLKMAHNLQRGTVQGYLTQDILYQFKKDLLDIILRIGITEGRNENMKWMANHPF